jgi:hypothetical protein
MHKECKVLPAGLMRGNCRKDFLETVRAAERSIDTDRKRIASGPAQPDVAYMELFFQRNAIVRERIANNSSYFFFLSLIWKK